MPWWWISLWVFFALVILFCGFCAYLIAAEMVETWLRGRREKDNQRLLAAEARVSRLYLEMIAEEGPFLDADLEWLSTYGVTL